MNEFWVILYTYPGWDGEIERLQNDFDSENGDDFLAFTDKQKAIDYMKAHNWTEKGGYEIKKVTVR